MTDKTRKEVSISTFAQLLEETAIDKMCESDQFKLILRKAFEKAIELCPLATVGENKNFYLADYDVPTIQLGDGGTTICDVIGDDGLHGICFSEAVENTGVGADHSDQVGGKRVHEIGAYFQILTDNPASLDVLIDKCQRAKAALEAGV